MKKTNWLGLSAILILAGTSSGCVTSRVIDARENSTGLSDVESPEVQAVASLCHVLMNSNEFLYVD